MRGAGKEADLIAAKKRDLAGIAYRLFCEKGIDNVSLQEIADNSDYGIASLYRYFVNKQRLVVESATLKWEEYLDEIRKRMTEADFERMTAAQVFGFYLDSFLLLYTDHRDLLKFNQFFNVYAQSEKIDQKTMEPYRIMIRSFKERFDAMYQKACLDHTIRTDESKEEMFSKTLHLMLAAITRYAVGLVYIPDEFDPIGELTMLKEMLLERYKESV